MPRLLIAAVLLYTILYTAIYSRVYRPAEIICHSGTEQNVHSETPLYPAWTIECNDGYNVVIID